MRSHQHRSSAADRVERNCPPFVLSREVSLLVRFSTSAASNGDGAERSRGVLMPILLPSMVSALMSLLLRLPAELLFSSDIEKTLFCRVAWKLLRRLGARVPIGLYWLWKLFLRHESAKLKASSLSLCSFLGIARYFGRGIGSPGRYTLLGHLCVDVLSLEDDFDRELLSVFDRGRKRFLAFSRRGMIVCDVSVRVSGCAGQSDKRGLSTLEADGQITVVVKLLS